MASTFYGSEVTINNGLANKAENSDLTTLQSAVENIWYPKLLPSGFDGTNISAMASLKNGCYWHAKEDGAKNLPSNWGFLIKFGFDNGNDYSALYFEQTIGSIYRCSGTARTISGWAQI